MKAYDSKSFTVTGTSFFNYFSFYRGISKYTVKNGAAPVKLFLVDTDKPAITLGVNEVFSFEGPFEAMHLQVVTSTDTSIVQIVEFPKFTT